MAKKDKSSRLTVANVVSVVGLMFLAFFVYIGHSYMSGGEIGMDILFGVLVAGAAALLLWWLIKAKGAENELSKWKTIEIASLIGYLLLIVPASLYFGINQFFAVNEKKELIKHTANQDLTIITKLFTDYEASANDALSRTRTGMLPAMGQKQRWSGDLTKFMNDNNIKHNSQSAELFVEIQEKALLGTSYEILKKHFMEQRTNISGVVNSWSAMLIPSKSKLIDNLGDQVLNQLNKLRTKATLPKVGYDSGSGVFTLEGTHEIPELKMLGELQFSNKLKSDSGFSVTALLVALGIHLLVLFNYIMAYRTSTIGISKDCEDDGGIILDL